MLPIYLGSLADALSTNHHPCAVAVKAGSLFGVGSLSPDQCLTVNPSISSSKAAIWAKQTCALPCRRVSCCLGFYLVFP